MIQFKNKKKKSTSLKKNALLNGFRSILNLIFPLVTFPYVSRVLDVDGIGKYNFSSSIVSYFLLIAGLGISTYAIREGARYRDDKEKIGQFASEVFSINIWSTVLAYLLLFVCLALFKDLRNYLLCILIFSIQIFFTTIGTEWIYTIYEEFSYITIRSIIFQIISVVLLFTFVRQKQDYIIYAAITVFSAVGANILNFIQARKYARIRFTFHVDWKRHLIPILVIFGSSVANMIYVNSDVTLLGLLKDNYVVGLYGISSKIYSMVKMLIASILIVTVPRLALLYGKRQVKQYRAILMKVTDTLMIATLPATVCLFMLSKNIILIFSGAKYLQATTSLQILSCAYIFSILAWILTDCVLLPAQRERMVLVSMGVSAVVNIALNFLLIPYWNENAAAFATVMAEFTMLVLNYFFGRDLVQGIYFSKKMGKNFIASAIGCSAVAVICWGIPKFVPSLGGSTMIALILSILAYVAILYFLGNNLAKELVADVKAKFK